MAQWRKGQGRCWRSPPERLEDANMKDVVDTRSFWQQQTVRDVANALGHLERASEPRAQLAPWSRQQRLHRSMEDVANEHLLRLMRSCCSRNAMRAALTCWRCDVHEGL